MYKLILLSYIPDFIFWILLTIYRNIKKKDIKFLKRNYIRNLNGWNIGHFLSYFAKGFFFKLNYIFHFFLFGFLFEIFEYYIQYKSNIKFVDSSIVIDPFINIFGYIFGTITIYIFRKFIKK